jgi:deoxyribose-phosphate aldolase
MTASTVAGLIDHAILQPTMTLEDADGELSAVSGLPLASVCVRPFFVSHAKSRLDFIPVAAVVGFPHGGEDPEIKREEALRALGDGAQDIDFVLNATQVLSGNWSEVEREIELLTTVTHLHSGIVKVIFENAYLKDEMKIRLCKICSDAGVDFVKTSTGFAYLRDAEGNLFASGATIDDVALMRNHASPEVGVKASGGIRTLADVQAMVEAGANRIGTASTLAILAEL